MTPQGRPLMPGRCSEQPLKFTLPRLPHFQGNLNASTRGVIRRMNMAPFLILSPPFGEERAG